jgi:Skp family chaperone for outer membrane proteins
MKKLGLSLLAIAMLLGIGCKAKPAAVATPAQRHAAVNPIAFVNEDQIIKAMGWDREIRQGLQIADRNLRATLNRRLLELSQQASDVRTRVAKAAKLSHADTVALQTAQTLKDLYALPINADQRQILLASGIQTNLAMSEARQAYRAQMLKREMELVGSYHSSVMPVAQTIANRLGFRMVLTISRNIVYRDPSTDVSDAVIAELKSSRPAWEQPDGQ